MGRFWEFALFVTFFPLVVSAAAVSIPVTLFCGIPLAILWAAIE